MERIKGKTLADFEGQEPSYSEKYEIFDPKKNANKFWHIYVFGNHIVRHHGRHGSKGLFTVHECYYGSSARNAARDFADKKYNKGYRDEASFLDRFVREV